MRDQDYTTTPTALPGQKHMSSKLFVTGCSLLSVGILCYAVAATAHYFGFFASMLVFGPWMFVGPAVITTTWLHHRMVPPSTEAEQGENWRRTFWQNWHVAFPYLTSIVMLIALIGAGTVAANALGLDPGMALPLYALAYIGCVRLAARWWRAWLAAEQRWP
jgi:hypothetical protein